MLQYMNGGNTRIVKIWFNLYGDNFSTSFGGNVYDQTCLSPALMTATGGGRTPIILVEDNERIHSL